MEMPTLDKFPREVLAGIDIQRAFIASRLIVAAERLQVFRTIHGKRMNAASIGRALNIHKFYRDAFLNSLVALGLLHKADATYWNTRLAEKYFIRGALDLLDAAVLEGMRAGVRSVDCVRKGTCVRAKLCLD